MKKHDFAKLYDLAVDDVYEWLRVLEHVHTGFEEMSITVDESPQRRREIMMTNELIQENVAFEESADAQQPPASESADIDCNHEDGLSSDQIIMTASAVLKPSSEEIDGGESTRVIDTMLELVTPTNSDNKVIPIVRDQEPFVEWTNNGRMIACAFPQLFLRGGKFLPTGTWSKELIQHLLRYYDGRFEQNTKFIALLFNQLQRHTAIKNAATVKISSTVTLQRFGALVTTERFRQRLLQAKEKPSSPATKRLNGSLLRVLSLVGSTVPFSPFERASSRPKISALRYRYGVPQHWLTVAPPEHDDLLLQRIAQIRETKSWNETGNIFLDMRCTFHDFSDDLGTNARKRLLVANQYPALAADVFQRYISMMFDDIISSETVIRASRHFRSRIQGPFGRIAAHCYVVEPQRDGRLHAHALLYGSTYTPELLTRISCSQPLRLQAATWLESVSSTKLQQSTHDWRTHEIESKHRVPRAFEIDLPDANANRDNFFAAAEKRVACTNFHLHSTTCYKPPRGKYVCRLARPAGVNEGSTRPLLITRDKIGDFSKGRRPLLSMHEVDTNVARVLDAGYDYTAGQAFRPALPGPLLWELHRPDTDKFVVETNRTLAALLQSHTNASIINGEDAGDVVEQYQQNYMTKDDSSLQGAIPVLLAAIDHINKYPSRAEDRDTQSRRGKYAASRTVNAFAGAHEWSHSVMAYAISGHRSFACSDSFWYVFPHLFVSSLARGNQSTRSQVVDSKTTSGVEIDSELEELVAMATNDSHHVDSSSVHGRCGGTRSYKVGEKTVFVSQVDSYIHRGEHFEAYSPVEFESIVDVQQPRDDPESRFGRCRRKPFPFAKSHPLYGSHCGYLRAKQHTPIFGGAPPPQWKTTTPSHRLAASRYLLAAFTNWLPDSMPFSFDESGLLDLCEQWDNSHAPLVLRQRYRYIRNFLKRGHRNSQFEQIITDWRNRNVDIWTNLKKNAMHDRPKPSDPHATTVDHEKLGLLGQPIDLYALTQSVVSGSQRKRRQLRAIRLGFESVMHAQSPHQAQAKSPAIAASAKEALVELHGRGISLSEVAARVSTLTQPPTNVEKDGHVSTGIAGVHDQLAGGEVCDQTLSKTQREVWNAVLAGIGEKGVATARRLTMLHGGGGTGKSFIVRKITEEIEQRGFEVVSTCTTGAGACQLTRGYTFHSAFKAGFKNTFAKLSRDLTEQLKQLFTPRVKLVVVDEASMLNPGLLVVLDERLRALYDGSQDFGGISILLVGDFLQLQAVRSLSLCSVMYVEKPSATQKKAYNHFSQFKVFFLTEQQRASGCQQQQRLLRLFRVLPRTYPAFLKWPVNQTIDFKPLTGEILQHLTRPITQQDVIEDPAWIDDAVILVTGNPDRAVLNACMARLIAQRTGHVVFRWRKKIATTDDHLLRIQDLLFDEDDRPTLFGYFLKDAIGQVLDNGNGNVSMGVANGSPCRYHSFAWDDPTKSATVRKTIKAQMRNESEVIDLPFPPDFINVILLDRDRKPLRRSTWPASENLASETDGDVVIIPIGICKSTHDIFAVKIAASVHHPELVVHYEQHAVDLAMALTIWKAQGSTYDRVILHLEGSSGSPSWGFEHLYVAVSRVRKKSHLRCLSLSPAFDRKGLLDLLPNVSTIRWRMDIENCGLWNGTKHQQPS